MARNNDILKKLVLEAKRDYEKDAEHRVHIFMADTSVFILRSFRGTFIDSDVFPRLPGPMSVGDGMVLARSGL